MVPPWLNIATKKHIKKHENTARTFRFVPIMHICKVYIIDTCAAKTHSHSKTIAKLRPNACILLFGFLKIHKVICKLNWLFSNFTYLPNFIIWLPSFSSPWLVKRESKCHLANFVFIQFLDFFHSVKMYLSPVSSMRSSVYQRGLWLFW